MGVIVLMTPCELNCIHNSDRLYITVCDIGSYDSFQYFSSSRMLVNPFSYISYKGITNNEKSLEINDCIKVIDTMHAIVKL